MTMTLSGDGTITGLVAGGLPDATITSDDLAAGAALNNAPNSVGFRNRIINGDMRIDQRNAGAAVTTYFDYPVDRFQVARGAGTEDATFSAQQDSDVPSTSGYTNSLKFTVTGAETSLGADERVDVRQRIEGFNVADFGFGAAGAKSVTLSFWVRSSLTGTFGGSLLNSASNRSYPYTYTISSADTWEYKTVTVAGDTSGTWIKNNGNGLTVFWSLGAGTNRAGTAGAWNANFNTGATGQVQVIETLNATWYITGVQLEVGSVATPFERRPYGTELSLCQRYFVKFGGDNADDALGLGFGVTTTVATTTIFLPVQMRTTPSVTWNALKLGDSVNSPIAVTNVYVDNINTLVGNIGSTVASGLTVFRPYRLRTSSSAGYVAYSAEL